MTINGGWMIGTGIHQRTRQRIAARLDGARKGRPMTASAWSASAKRKDAGRQVLAARRDLHLVRPVLARQPRQGAGLGEGDTRLVAGLPGRLRQEDRTERARRQEHHLPVRKMRRELLAMSA